MEAWSPSVMQQTADCTGTKRHYPVANRADWLLAFNVMGFVGLSGPNLFHVDKYNKIMNPFSEDK